VRARDTLAYAGAQDGLVSELEVRSSTV